MSGWLRKARAGVVVALVFGVAWATIVLLCFLGAVLLVGGVEGLLIFGRSVHLVYAIWVAIGVVQGGLVSAAISLTKGKWTVDTFPRWLGALIGGGVGTVGWLLILLLDRPLSGGALSAATVMGLVVGLIGAASTSLLFTLARRGSLPVASREPEQIGS